MFEAVVGQAQMLRGLGAEPVVIGVRDAASEEDRWRFGDAEVLLAEPRGPQALAYSPDLDALVAGAKLDLLHLHGIWQYPSHVAGRFARTTRKPLVISPHGMLDPWITSRNAWKKHAARFLWEREAWSSASAFHALTEAEARDIAAETGASRIDIVPNAAPALSGARTDQRPPMALYLGRIHPKKNITALVDAWLQVRGRLPADAVLTIAGWGDDEGIAALESAMPQGGASGIEFVGTAFGSQKAALLDLARFLVLPSQSEGLPMAVLEAWAAGVPTLMSEACHLPEGFAAGAAIDCGTGSDTIAAALLAAFAMPDSEWDAMSLAARNLASGPFSQASVAKRWEGSYAALL
ncbi:glycosyltransferase [Qipengyuania gaetbuli]|uniref:glycosyltransferase n=1 Tax=Qipengyuania gaetbuli TaxID=266952 RepID=UPI001CFCA45C|nr:glycosyltransferase [Qipengyuania gaetbuli]